MNAILLSAGMLVLLVASASSIPAHAGDCVGDADCWFRQLNEAFCRDNPTQCKTGGADSGSNKILFPDFCPERLHLEYKDFDYFQRAQGLAGNLCEMVPDEDPNGLWGFKCVHTGATWCPGRTENDIHRECYEICTRDPQGKVVWGCGCKPLDEML